ncbi:hypothetical protein XENOCAPTIV_017233 [Xenoophorus captivus]|uniref:Uncharacterized protein n=1 Tax=Xenoophorus captivus TaxID=1517983 RepID=A0ABV0RAJ8_9TELE
MSRLVLILSHHHKKADLLQDREDNPKSVEGKVEEAASFVHWSNWAMRKFPHVFNPWIVKNWSYCPPYFMLKYFPSFCNFLCDHIHIQLIYLCRKMFPGKFNRFAKIVFNRIQRIQILAELFILSTFLSC